MIFPIRQWSRMREAGAGAGGFPGSAEPSAFGNLSGAAEPSAFADFPEPPAAPREEVRATGKDILAMILAVWSMLMPVVLGTGAILAALCWAFFR